MYQSIHRPQKRFRGSPIKPQFSWQGWLLAYLLAILLLIALSYVVGPYSVMQNYRPFSNDIVGKVQIQSTRIPHLLTVQFDVLDKYHHPVQKESCYIKQGNQLTFSGDILAFIWNLPGLYSGFKLTRFSGCYTDATLKSAFNLSNLNGGDDNYFTGVRNFPWLFPTVQAQYSQPVPILADVTVGQPPKTFLLLITPAGLIASPMQ